MSKSVIKIGLAEDQTMFRKGLVSLLNGLEDVEVVVQAENGKELLKKLKNNKVDIALLDYKMPVLNGAKTAQMIAKKYPEIKILFLSMYDEEEFIIQAIENGANGYITKDEDIDEIERALHSLVNTGYYMNDGTSKLLIGNLLSNGKLLPKFSGSTQQLTDTETLVIKLICDEYSSREIAKMLRKGERTVEAIRSNILKKTGAKNSNGIVMYAVKKGIVEV
ncbi:MAG: response regulator transcription factor [Crocinitomicaceae bacterium]